MCSDIGIYGYTVEVGGLVNVEARSVPSKDGKQQRFQVIKLTRYFNDLQDPEKQRKNSEQVLDIPIGTNAFPTNLPSNVPCAQMYVNINRDSQGNFQKKSYLIITESAGNEAARRAKIPLLAKLPGC